MNIVVLIKQVPDLVEGLEVDSTGKDLDREWLKLKFNEFDDHALEEALLLKEELGATVTAMAIDAGEETDKLLFTAAAKGADKIVKVTGSFGNTVSSHLAAKAFANVLASTPYDLVLTGVQAIDDRDGQLSVILAQHLGVPNVSVVTEVKVVGDKVNVHKEFGGGVVAEYESAMPIVLGVQAARQTPRYVPVARVRQIMRSATLEEVSGGDATVGSGSEITRYYKPESGGSAEKIDGSPAEQAQKIVELLKSKGIK